MKPPTPDSVARDLAHFVHPTQFVELRALHVGGRGRTFAGWFDGEHLHDMARHALALARQAAGVYFTPNPVSPILAAKRLNRVLDVHKGFALTHDSDVVERRYLVIDLDPARLHFDPVTDAYLPTQDVPTTARELAFALRVARGFIRPFLADLGFPDPVTMLSGNGVHLAYRIDSLPGGKVGSAIDPAAKLLALLHDRYSCAGVTVDANTYNPCRMLKVPGTTVRRGEPTRSRPQRNSIGSCRSSPASPRRVCACPSTRAVRSWPR